MKKLPPLHIQILLALVLGLIYGLIAVQADWITFTENWINPWGTIFVRLLKLIAVPLVIASLIVGVASLSDLRKLSRIGGKTIALYLFTTVIALIIGVSLANIIKPGLSMPTEVKDNLQSLYEEDVSSKSSMAVKNKGKGPLQFLVDTVPSNVFLAVTDNRAMLQIVFFALLFGICLIQIKEESSRPMIDFFSSANDVIIKMVDIIMLMAPLGVFALIAKTVTGFAGQGTGHVLDLLASLGLYCITVILGLGIHTLLVLPCLLKLFTPMKLHDFFRGIAPVQLLAFSTSSGSALILGVDRILDMLRTTTNVTGDTVVASIVAASEGQLKPKHTDTV